MVKSKNAFWQALIFTILIFGTGLLIGFFVEEGRSDSINEVLMTSEINLLDQQIRTSALSQFEINCAISKQSTFEFADRIYEEALQLERFDASAKFTNTLEILHKRYDLLRVLLWIESKNLKENCNTDFHTLVYIYEYEPESLETEALQASTSRLLTDVKNVHPDEILLIPFAGNLEIESVNLILEQYEIKTLPAIIIDEKEVVTEQITLTELEDLIFRNQNSDKIFLN